MASEKVQFETRECSRCRGKGYGDWVVQNGVCFKCGGKGRVLTAKGQADRSAWIESHTEVVAASAVRVGDRLVNEPSAGPVVRIVEITGRRRPDDPELLLVFANVPEMYGATAKRTDTIKVWRD